MGRVTDEFLRPSAYLLHMMNRQKSENLDRDMALPDILISRVLYSCLLAASLLLVQEHRGCHMSVYAAPDRV
jgi:hypothetical protein